MSVGQYQACFHSRQHPKIVDQRSVSCDATRVITQMQEKETHTGGVTASLDWKPLVQIGTDISWAYLLGVCKGHAHLKEVQPLESPVFCFPPVILPFKMQHTNQVILDKQCYLIIQPAVHLYRATRGKSEKVKTNFPIKERGLLTLYDTSCLLCSLHFGISLIEQFTHALINTVINRPHMSPSKLPLESFISKYERKKHT